jgi:hypothetical protein
VVPLAAATPVQGYLTMNYMDVSRLVTLLAGGAAAGIRQNQDKQSALPTPD